MACLLSEFLILNMGTHFLNTVSLYRIVMEQVKGMERKIWISVVILICSLVVSKSYSKPGRELIGS